ncbi:hypothetical protein C5F48_16820 [Cereibacter changlensis JA139]|uniref:Uncharacterized protein n=1 Tax=Cereibacter changlensis JA139 TaxID=1188249 RepID=A0A2T4JRX7_9RHOB|nr:hypothetical protein C5F48_16820 [Cereibacter changlensis JA139]
MVLVARLFLAAVSGIFRHATDRGCPLALAMNTLVMLENFHLFFIRNLHGASLTRAAARPGRPGKRRRRQGEGAVARQGQAHVPRRAEGRGDRKKGQALGGIQRAMLIEAQRPAAVGLVPRGEAVGRHPRARGEQGATQRARPVEERRPQRQPGGGEAVKHGMKTERDHRFISGWRPSGTGD